LSKNTNGIGAMLFEQIGKYFFLFFNQILHHNQFFRSLLLLFVPPCHLCIVKQLENKNAQGKALTNWKFSHAKCAFFQQIRDVFCIVLT
jgi:hypothetical protein